MNYAPAPPPAPPAQLNIYGLLRKLVNGEVWSEQERRDAQALISDLEAVGTFGNLAAKITTNREESTR